MSYEIFDTFSLWESVNSDDYIKEMAQDLGVDIEDITEDELYWENRTQFECEMDNLKYGLKHFIERYEKRYKTKIANMVFLGDRSSHYGWIGGAGRAVGTEIGSTSLNDLSVDCDDFGFYITEDGKLELVTYDHDGRNYMELVLVTQTEQYLCDEQYEDVRIFLDKKGKNSVKLDKQFLDSFGYKHSQSA